MDGGGCSLCSLEEEFTFDENEERKEEKAMRKQKKIKKNGDAIDFPTFLLPFQVATFFRFLMNNWEWSSKCSLFSIVSCQGGRERQLSFGLRCEFE